MSNKTKYLTCVTCGKEYKGCRTCESAREQGQHMWRQSCDTPECYQALLVINDYFYKRITRQEAKVLLGRVLTDEMKPYHENSRTIIKEILAEDMRTNPQKHGSKHVK